MRRTLVSLLVIVALLLLVVGPVAADSRTYTAHLVGASEVPPVDADSRGQAILRLSPDSSELHFRLIVANIENVTAAHIHLAAAGVNGPVVVWLYRADSPPVEPAPGSASGVLAAGVLTSADLIGNLSGQPLQALVDAFDAGNAYVNVHTTVNIGGEMRGQIR